jgi:hypothetical protein
MRSRPWPKPGSLENKEPKPGPGYLKEPIMLTETTFAPQWKSLHSSRVRYTSKSARTATFFPMSYFRFIPAAIPSPWLPSSLGKARQASPPIRAWNAAFPTFRKVPTPWNVHARISKTSLGPAGPSLNALTAPHQVWVTSKATGALNWYPRNTFAVEFRSAWTSPELRKWVPHEVAIRWVRPAPAPKYQPPAVASWPSFAARAALPKRNIGAAATVTQVLRRSWECRIGLAFFVATHILV